MDAAAREQRLRLALWGLAAAILVVTPVELVLTEHFEPGPQLVPYVLSVLGLGSVGAAGLRPGQGTLRAARWAMGLLIAGSVFGCWEHLEHNFGFAVEIAPNGSFAEHAKEAVLGSNPLLAPGIYGLAGLCGLAAGWRHPRA